MRGPEMVKLGTGELETAGFVKGGFLGRACSIVERLGCFPGDLGAVTTVQLCGRLTW